MTEEKEKKKKKEAGENVKIYARVRQLMPWEPRKVSLQIKGNKIRNHTNKTTNEYSFQKVFPIEWTNEEMFKVMVEPMIANVLNGFNAILIAYGQTGSGKTFSMLGKPHLNVIGLLPYMLKRVVETPGVTKVNLTAVEAFGHHVARIELYDLFDAVNQTPNWGEKVGNTGLEPEKATSVPIKDMDDAYQKIEYAHRGSHFAPTGKNPESSRGHVTFIASITQADANTHTELTSYFAMVDCAGSEGESAFTPDFIAAVDKTTLMARRLEAGCINTGLSQLQIVFNELRVKGKLSEMRGNGLRRVLHPYINTRTYLSVLFTFSPSVNNSKPTESTLKFAVAAGMVKVQPVKVELSVNMEQLIHQLRRHIEENDKLIEEQNDKIMNLRADLEKLLQDAITAGDLPGDFVVEAETELEVEDEEETASGERVHRVYSSTLAKEMTKRQEENHSTLPSKLLSQLKELDEDEDEEEMVFDEKIYTEGEGGKLSQKDVEKEMEAALQRMQKTNRGDEMIKKAVMVDQTKSNTDKTKDAMQQLAGTLEAAKFDPSLATDPEEPLFENVTVAMDFSRMNKKELKEVCVETFDKIEKNRDEQTHLQKKQQAVVGHLVETNEWLFNTLSEILNDTKNDPNNKDKDKDKDGLKKPTDKNEQKRPSVTATNK